MIAQTLIFAVLLLIMWTIVILLVWRDGRENKKGTAMKDNDLISRSALLEQECFMDDDNGFRCSVVLSTDVRRAHAVDAIPVDKVAEMLYESFGDPYACNFNGNDEWLPMVCDNLNECPDVKDKLYCWKQFIKHYEERRADE